MSTTAHNFTETQYKAMPGQVSTDELQGIVECFVAGIGNKDSVGDICLPGAFDASLKRRKPRVVWGHNWNEPIGKVLDIYEVGPKDPRLPEKMRAQNIGGLFARVQFNLKSERGREAFSNVSFFGEEQEWSIGYKTLDAIFDTTRQANLLKEVELYEVSPVLHGANQLTATISIKSDTMETESPEFSSNGEFYSEEEFDDFYEEEIDEKGERLRDPKGGLTAAGRAHFKRTEGANLKPGVKGPANTPEKMRRKGSFLTRFFTNPSGPMKDEKGRPTRLALSAAAWGEPVPQNAEDAAALAAKGRRMLERYQNAKGKNYDVDADYKQLGQTIGQRSGGAIGAGDSGDGIDRDGDGIIFDGTPEEQRAPYKRSSNADYEKRRRAWVRARLLAQGIKPNARVENRSEEERNARARARAEFDRRTYADGIRAQQEDARKRSINSITDSAQRRRANEGVNDVTDAATRRGQTDSRRRQPNRMPDSAERRQNMQGRPDVVSDSSGRAAAEGQRASNIRVDTEEQRMANRRNDMRGNGRASGQRPARPYGLKEQGYSIYSETENESNPITGKMGMLARHLGNHFNSNVRVREANENMVIFDIDRDGKPETMRVAYHSPEPNTFMFGASTPVRAQVVYVPMGGESNMEDRYNNYDMPRSVMPQKPHGDCGCGCKGSGTCDTGGEMKSWSDYKMDTPGVHMFIKTMNMDLFSAVNEIADEYGFDVELLNDGFVIPNVDFYDTAVNNDVVALLGGLDEKGLARGLARGLRGAVSRGGRRPSRDGDNDGKITNPLTGRDELPAPPKPRMMPPREIPKEIPEKQPQTVPTRTPSRPTVPSTPVRPTVPQRPRVPVGVSGRMGAGDNVPKKPKKRKRKPPTDDFVIPGNPGMTRDEFDRRTSGAFRANEANFPRVRDEIVRRLQQGDNGVSGNMGGRKNRRLLGEHILQQLREYEMDPSSPSKPPKRAMEMALDEIAKRNAMTRKQLDKILRKLIMQERRNAVLRRSGRIKSAEPNIYISISEISDLSVKSGFQVDSREIDTLVIDAEPEMMFAVKSAVDSIGQFYGFESVATDEGILIKNSSYLPSEALEAVANAYMNISGEYDLVDFELNRLSA